MSLHLRSRGGFICVFMCNYSATIHAIFALRNSSMTTTWRAELAATGKTRFYFWLTIYNIDAYTDKQVPKTCYTKHIYITGYSGI